MTAQMCNNELHIERRVRQRNCKHWLHVYRLRCYRWLQFESGNEAEGIED